MSLTLSRVQKLTTNSLIATKSNITLDQAMERFYGSEVFLLIQDGVADLHCRSDQYLADEVCREKLKQ